MYGLKEAGILAFNFIVKNLTPFRYTPVRHISGLWKHGSRPTMFTLCMDDFGIKYHTQEDLDNLLSVL